MSKKIEHLNCDTQDRFTPDPGEVDEAYCGVCKEKMTVRRDVNGPTGYVEAMAKMGHPHDAFDCPNREEMWHRQAIRIREEANQTASAKLAEMLRAEANEIVRNTTATVDYVSRF